MSSSMFPRIPRPKKSTKIPPYVWVLAGNAPLLWALFRPLETDAIAKIVSALVILVIFILIFIAGANAKVTSLHPKFPTILILLAVPFLFPALIVMLFVFGDKRAEPETPPRPSPSQPPEQAGPLPDFPTSRNSIWYSETEGMFPGAALSKRSLFSEFSTPFNGRSTIKHKPKGIGITTGTANALNDGTLWLTARHVVSDCVKIAIVTGRQDWSIATNTFLHPTADVALLEIPSLNNEREPLVFAKGHEDVKRAFGIGFPWGRPGGWSGMYLGKAYTRHKGEFSGSETTTVWSEVSRIPHQKLHMGGISGGAVLDKSGHLIGITIAGHPRRGRHDVSTLDTINDVLEKENKESSISKTSSASRFNITDYDYPVFIKSLIRKNRIAKVICHKG